ncbi:hypothetical protein VP1G_10841 [Cytospora mali]|uniref:Uncharacterized protein n=1 Tax=Cytospora mali TaxID=578113 RepID=A0A194UWY2_CYTMA|nr:hypothetical protein VP1G_10841 [Valsa mali var. pyri (nom. inval.)]
MESFLHKACVGIHAPIRNLDVGSRGWPDSAPVTLYSICIVCEAVTVAIISLCLKANVLRSRGPGPRTWNFVLELFRDQVQAVARGNGWCPSILNFLLDDGTISGYNKENQDKSKASTTGMSNSSSKLPRRPIPNEATNPSTSSSLPCQPPKQRDPSPEEGTRSSIPSSQTWKTGRQKTSSPDETTGSSTTPSQAQQPSNTKTNSAGEETTHSPTQKEKHPKVLPYIETGPIPDRNVGWGEDIIGAGALDIIVADIKAAMAKKSQGQPLPGDKKK